MRIHSLTIDNVRAIEHLELTELPATGVIVIHGDNEQGKSTILDAINIVLTQKHGANNKYTKPLRPVHRDASPAVSLSASMGQVSFTIEKTWFKGKSARLQITSPQRESLTGEQAEARLEEIISEHLDQDLFSTLFLRQDDLGASVAAAGIPTLSKALDGSSATKDTPGTEDLALMAAVEKQYLRYFTAAAGKETGELKKAREICEAAQEEWSQAAADNAELNEFVSRFDRMTRDRELAKDELPAAEAEATELGEKAELAAKAQAQADALCAEVARAAEDLAHAQELIANRKLLAQEIDTANEGLAELTSGLEEAAAAAEQESAQLELLEKQLADAHTRQHKAGTDLRLARKQARLLEASARRDDLADQLAQLDELNEDIQRLLVQSSGYQVTDDDVRKVEEASSDLLVQQQLHAQAAAKLEVTATTGTSITVDGETVELGQESVAVELKDGMEVVIAGVSARYLAGLSESGSGADLVASAQDVLEELLETFGAQDLAGVRDLRDAAREATEQLAALNRQRSALLSGKDPEELAAEHKRLLADLDQDAELPEDLDAAAAAVVVAKAEQEQDAAGEEAATLAAALSPFRQRRHSQAYSELKIRIEAAEETLAVAKRRLAATDLKASAEDLAAGVEKASLAHDDLIAQLALAQEKVAAVDPKLASDLHEGALARVASLRDSVIRCDNELAKLSGGIGLATGAAERLEKAESALEAATHRLDSVTRRAEAARLLRESMHRHRDIVRARYAQPFADQLSQLARTVFGHDVEFGLSEDLAVTHRSIGASTVDLESLSGGAKEQLAILTRFAIAGLVSRESDDGQVPVPVVIDDALGSTDPSRLQLMATLFSEMGKTSQVIVLTCVPQRYDRVVGRQEFAIADLKATGRLL
ncbi:AAA family ATPase [Corynebacterium alimapuense]|uniref:ATP-binding protein n=1 Tax=Corynebacterium alimapuense TaxID=1576874 RepID=A0A3M8K5C3_9CORY|nr:AAA family ATPase [Corynebacterium alimapuense]RNE48423.1 ATP-binding protein [Corynebacterium alimapuense]